MSEQVVTLALDPGPTQTALCVWDGAQILPDKARIAFRVIGNGVPVLMAQRIAESFDA